MVGSSQIIVATMMSGQQSSSKWDQARLLPEMDWQFTLIVQSGFPLVQFDQV